MWMRAGMEMSCQIPNDNLDGSTIEQTVASFNNLFLGRYKKNMITHDFCLVRYSKTIVLPNQCHTREVPRQTPQEPM